MVKGSRGSSNRSRSYHRAKPSRKCSTPYKSSSKKSARASSSNNKPAYTYQANLSGGRKYIGMATSKAALKKRIQTQLSGGKGASSVCRQSKPTSISRVFKHASVAAAKKAETARYHSTKAILGAHKVRGAGHTKAFPK
mmetsp:Transcript_324/g.367  ORF Transcript_324/g.367 Transcript_324/m.367 type:complete len:139 (-) Transcript_324:318-734(-)|eukprot:CAMPEP_0197451220 /NCGR_PEP_ID=MMETSP1175-20131217/28133_1 /TAXON_ID=1003142 /ORGANISM="Triceratium dubium, Strain CCMP147" /LENGTH=138 /DNA_ID=CAMNT_0042983863 /DNA_START=59 /DNA_END=475 /DNA_ORIENTATION=+